MRRLRTALALSAAALLLAACGQTTPAVGSKPLTQAQANDLKVIAPYLGSSMVGGLRGAGQGTASGANRQSFVSGTCSATAFTDNDRDKIPVGYSARFQDCTEDKVLFIQTTNGDVAINDDNDNDPKSGFTSKGTNLATDFFVRASAGVKGRQVFRVVNNWDVKVGVSSASASVDYRYSVGLTSFKTDGTQDKTWNGSLNFTGSYVPDSDGNLDNFDAGTINLRGTLILGDFALNQTVSDLKFNSSCLAGPVSGKIRYDDGGANSLEMTYTGCNSGTFTYNTSGSGSF